MHSISKTAISVALAIVVLNLAGSAFAQSQAGNTASFVNAQVDESARKKPVDKQLAGKLQAALNKAVRETGIPGVTALIISPQGTWLGASGVSNLSTKSPMLPDDIFNIGSATKTFTAATVLKLAEQGKLNLDDTLGKWLPEIAQKIPGGKRITIRQILNGSSGIYDYTDSPQFRADAFANTQRHWHPQELVAYVYGKPRFQGTQCTPKWCYPNTGMVLAGMIVEKATGSTFPKVMRQQIFNPLKLNHTFFGGEEQIVGRQARGYQDIIKADGSPGQDGIPDDLTDVNRSLSWATGSIFSNVQDQARFSEALFGGKLLKPQSLNEMLTFIDTALGEYGLSVIKRKTPWGTMLGHGGDDIGYIAGRWYFPESGVTAVYLINRQNEFDNPQKDPTSAVFSAIMNPILGEPKGSYSIPK